MTVIATSGIAGNTAIPRAPSPSVTIPDRSSRLFARRLVPRLLRREPIRLEPGLLPEPAHPLVNELPAGLTLRGQLVPEFVAVGGVQRGKRCRLPALERHDIKTRPGLVGRDGYR